MLNPKELQLLDTPEEQAQVTAAGSQAFQKTGSFWLPIGLLLLLILVPLISRDYIRQSELPGGLLALWLFLFFVSVFVIPVFGHLLYRRFMRAYLKNYFRINGIYICDKCRIVSKQSQDKSCPECSHPISYREKCGDT